MLTKKPLTVILAALMMLATTTLLATGCSTPPKPKELVELERILQSPDAREVRDTPGASKYFRQSREYRRNSLEAHRDGRIERAREYAILGTLRYRTAEAIREQHEAKERLEGANAKVAEVNPEIQTLSQERNKLTREITQLERRVNQARSQKAQREREKQMLEQASNQGSKVERNQEDYQKKLRQAESKLQEAQAAREKAAEVKAEEYASVAFDRASGHMRSARALIEKGASNPDLIIETADKATKHFQEAAKEAEPKYQAYLEKMKPSSRRTALRKEAANNFGGPFTFEEPHGVRVVLAMLFAKGSTTVTPASKTLVKTLAEIANEYEEATISIEGYTRRGNATENLATSQLRARTVRDFLVSEGIDASRLTTNGFGQDRRRYSDSPGKNDRVEVILRITD